MADCERGRAHVREAWGHSVDTVGTRTGSVSVAFSFSRSYFEVPAHVDMLLEGSRLSCAWMSDPSNHASPGFCQCKPAALCIGTSEDDPRLTLPGRGVVQYTPASDARMDAGAALMLLTASASWRWR